MVKYLILLILLNCTKQNTIGQLCRSEDECTTGCCALTPISLLDQVKYLCQNKGYCNKNRIYGAPCFRSSDCSSDCCHNSKCDEYDACFENYIKPIITALLVSGILFLSLITLITWIWIVCLFRKNYRAKNFYERLKEHIDNILAQDDIPTDSMNEEES